MTRREDGANTATYSTDYQRYIAKKQSKMDIYSLCKYTQYRRAAFIPPLYFARNSKNSAFFPLKNGISPLRSLFFEKCTFPFFDSALLQNETFTP